jgi:hypothetical protein
MRSKSIWGRIFCLATAKAFSRPSRSPDGVFLMAASTSVTTFLTSTSGARSSPSDQAGKADTIRVAAAILASRALHRVESNAEIMY